MYIYIICRYQIVLCNCIVNLIYIYLISNRDQAVSNMEHDLLMGGMTCQEVLASFKAPHICDDTYTQTYI